ncbi:hypothetical protein [Streptomyces rubellomurinus]|uniref:hypothetical protein n=1 Tax=Streptomyces rubellomurinus (strain ATCC 31215) TaxID=359131 RepID=UPI0007C6375D|nr:hypothetical protein [Streptomyces rubellomurinus]
MSTPSSMSRRRPTPPALTDTERTRLDHLVRRAAVRLGPDEAGVLLRLWEHSEADHAQARRTAGGARATARRAAQCHAETLAQLRRARAAHQAAVAEARRQARRASSAHTTLSLMSRVCAEQVWAASADPAGRTDEHVAVMRTEAAALTRLHAALDDAGIDLTAELDRIAAAYPPPGTR